MPSRYMSSVAASCRVILGWCYTQTQHSTVRSCPTPGNLLSCTLSTVLRMVKQGEWAIAAVPRQGHNSVASSDTQQQTSCWSVTNLTALGNQSPRSGFLVVEISQQS